MQIEEQFGDGERSLSAIENEQVFNQIKRARAEADRGFDPLPPALTLLLNRVSSTLTKASSIDLEQIRVTAMQFNVLVVLHRSERPMSMRQLATELSVRPPNLTAVVDSLAKRKLVMKSVSQHDRRSFRVFTTTTGDELIGSFLPSHWRFMQEFYAGLDATQRFQLAALLDRLLASISSDEPGNLNIAPRILAAAREND